MKHTCVLCRNVFEGEEPAVLFVSRYGNPRVLCTDCEGLLDAALTEGEGKEEARRQLVAATAACRDKEALATLRRVLEGEQPNAEEAEAIEDAYEEVRMTEAEEAEEAALEAEERRRENSFLSWLPVIVAGAAAVAFMVWFWFFRG